MIWAILPPIPADPETGFPGLAEREATAEAVCPGCGEHFEALVFDPRWLEVARAVWQSTHPDVRDPRGPAIDRAFPEGRLTHCARCDHRNGCRGAESSRAGSERRYAVALPGDRY